MLIKRINKISKCGIFQDFTWAKDLPEFKRINLIYGSNGVGKSSLARALDEELLATSEAKVVVSVRNSKEDDQEITLYKTTNDLSKRLFIFSDNYIQRSHRLTIDEAEMDAILTLGKRTIEAEDLITQIKQEIDIKETQVKTLAQSIATEKKLYHDGCKKLANKIIADVKNASGKYNERSYNAGTVKKHYESSQVFNKLTLKELATKKSLLNSETKLTIKDVPELIVPNEELISRLSSVLQQTPSNVILNTLEQHPEAARWVKEGRVWHRAGDACIFSGSEVSARRIREIDSHFSDAVEELTGSLQKIRSSIENNIESNRSIVSNLPNRLEFFNDLQGQIDELYNKLQESLRAVEGYFCTLIDQIDAKLKQIFTPIDVYAYRHFETEIKSINLMIEQHNSRVTNYANEIQSAAEAIEGHYLADEREQLMKHKMSFKQAQAESTALSKELEQLNTRVDVLSHVDGDPLPSAQVLTRDVAQLLGRNELKFEVVDGKLRVLRNGLIAKGLSAGEKTAIMLVHFFELVAKYSESENRPIVIIDDPVSSLDNEIFHGASTYIWSKLVSTDFVSQSIILTHNFEFFRQWVIQLSSLPKKVKNQYPYEVYQLKSVHRTTDQGKVRSSELDLWPSRTFTRNNRKKLCSTYHHYFMKLAEAKIQLDSGASLDIKQDATLLFPNVMRRMLEMFLAFKFPHHLGNFTVSMQNSVSLIPNECSDFDFNALRLRLTRYTHSFSHNESLDVSETTNVDEIHRMINDVFTFVYLVDQIHFEGMCESLGQDACTLLPNEFKAH